MIWVGKLGATPIAAVGVASIIVMLVVSVKMGLAVGARAMIARFIGSGDTEGANHIAQQAFVISAVFGVVMTVIGVSLAEPILILFGLEADVVAQGAAYMRIVFVGWTPFSFWLMEYTVMQASGDTMTPMKIAFFWSLVHVALCPFLVFGWWIFPRLGVSGAALTNVVSQTVGMLLGLWYLFTGRTRIRLTLRNFRLDLNIIWRIVRIGIPATVMSAQRSIGGLLLMRFITPFGTLAVAAHSLAQKADSVLFMPGGAVGQAAGVLVGQNLGAHQPERAERNGWQAVGWVEGFMIIGAVAIFLWAEHIVGIFSTEPDVVAITSTFMRIHAVGCLVSGFTGVLQNSISGAGDTVPPMLVSLVILWLVQLPLAFFLSQVTDLGVYGVRWAMVASMFVGAAFYTTYFRLGRWKRKKI